MKDFMSIAHSMSDTFCGHEWYEQSFILLSNKFNDSNQVKWSQ